MTTAQAFADLLRLSPSVHVPCWRWASAETPAGYQYRDPRAIDVCRGAGLPLDVGALACAGASEFPARYPAYILAGMACIINDAQAVWPREDLELQIHYRVTRAKVMDGYYGRQNGRWCSSYQRPTLRMVEGARLALDGVGSELARGGRRWLDCRVQDSGAQGKIALRKNALEIVRSRYLEGWRWVGPQDDIDPYVLMMLGKEGVSLERAEAAIQEGRKRWKVTLDGGR